MIKKTLYFGNPVYLSQRLNQMLLEFPPSTKKEARTIPIEDVGLMVLDHQQITITHALVNALINNNAAVLWCDEKHLPNGLVLPFAQNHTFTEKIRTQLDASEPLKKQLWKQTVQQKIINQAAVLQFFDFDAKKLQRMADKVQSGDPDNYEGQAAAWYWTCLMKQYETKRGREEGGPNIFLNYGYALLRAVTARSLVGSGCLPAVGIFHRNKYNAFCLADDIMEPYRPYVDRFVFEYLHNLTEIPEKLSTTDKGYLLNIPVIDTLVENRNGPLMVNMQRTTAGLMNCFEGSARKIPYPTL